MNRKKRKVPEYTKETPEARKKRASSGIKFRAVIFESKRRKLLEKDKRGHDDE